MAPETTLKQGSIACVILARGGSKGLPQKNLQKIAGVSLIARSVKAAQRSGAVDAVYVSTDHKGIADEARRYGAVVIDRPADLADDGSSSEAGWLHALPYIRGDFPNLSRLVFLQCTSPFTQGHEIDACLETMRKEGADCALSVTKDHGFMWQMTETGAGGTNHDATQPRQRRQDLPPQYRESGAIYCVDADQFERTGQRFFGRIAMHVLAHPPIEIDSRQDFDLCTLIAQTQNAPDMARDRLSGVKAVVMDFDGVHTDNRVFTDQNGGETVRTSRSDGMGVSMLRETGRWHMLILSKERNPVVLQRAAKLQLDVQHSTDDKVLALEKWIADRGLEWRQVLYVGNDVNDRAVMDRAGLSACPMDAHPSILSMADWVLPLPGGKGALRCLSDALLAVA